MMPKGISKGWSLALLIIAVSPALLNRFLPPAFDALGLPIPNFWTILIVQIAVTFTIVEIATRVFDTKVKSGDEPE